MYGIERVARHLASCGDTDLEESIANLTADVARWEGEGGQEDDMSMILIEFLGEDAAPGKLTGEEVNRRFQLERR